jgi:hypothetical protein
MTFSSTRRPGGGAGDGRSVEERKRPQLTESGKLTGQKLNRRPRMSLIRRWGSFFAVLPAVPLHMLARRNRATTASHPPQEKR